MDEVDYAQLDHLPQRLSLANIHRVEYQKPDLPARSITPSSDLSVMFDDGETRTSSHIDQDQNQVSFISSDIDLQMGQYSLAFTEFWPDRDLRDSIETDLYIKRLQDHSHLDLLKQELFYNCRRNFSHRLRCLCQFLKKNLRIELDDLKLRGQVSQTSLHSALIHDSSDAAKVLIDSGGKTLVLTPYTKKEFFGVTTLHIAVVKGNSEIIRMMMDLLTEQERIWLLQTPSTGSFFRQRFSASSLALTLAAWSNHMAVFDMLLAYGAELDAVGSITGNNIIHSLVEYSVMDSPTACKIFHDLLFRQSCTLWWCRKMNMSMDDVTEDSLTIMRNWLLRQTNKQQYTPLQLAARLGSCCIFNEIVNMEGVYKFTQWTYGPVTTILYDVSEIDSAIPPAGALSAMEMLLRTVPENELGIFSCEPLNTLIHTKWAAYKRLYYLTSAIHLLVMTIFSWAVFYARPHNVDMNQEASESNTTEASLLAPGVDNDTLKMWHGMNLRDGAVLGCGIVVILYILIRLIPWLFDNIHKIVKLVKGRLHRGPSVAYSTSLYSYFGFNPIGPVSVLYYISSLLWFILYVLDSSHTKIWGGFGLLFGWYLCLVYLTPFKNIAILTLILNRMLAGDLIRFLAIFIIIFIAFTSSLMCFLGTNQPSETSTFLGSYWALLRVMVGLYDMDEAISRAEYPFTARIVTFLFIIVTMIQLLNMLIAAMNNTFASTYNDSDHLWKKLLADATVSFEDHLPRCVRPKESLQRGRTLDEGWRITSGCWR